MATALMRSRRLLLLFLLGGAFTSAQPARWSPQQASDWNARQPWLVGSNYLPAYAINELEMWQPQTFDSKRIDIELGWAQSLGFNVMRVFLHDLPWQQDAAGFRKRMDTFLSIAEKHHIRILFVLFDSCWDPSPRVGKQHAPRPGVHNSGWVQSPGAKALSDPSQYSRLEAYVKGVVGAFASDPRVLGWDVWNEPDNDNASSYASSELPNKAQLVLALLPKVFAWAREAGAIQPLTSGVWKGDWSSPEKLTAMEKIQLDQSDVISFHNYAPPEDFQKHVQWLEPYGRPLLCTEYMARPTGSTFEAILPVAEKDHVAAINWGFVAGKSQTYLPWDSWQKPYVDAPPKVWFHDIFRTDGTPYNQQEVNFLRQLLLPAHP
jgi:Cellulase (glycosyl hydrolase family 5)